MARFEAARRHKAPQAMLLCPDECTCHWLRLYICAKGLWSSCIKQRLKNALSFCILSYSLMVWALNDDPVLKSSSPLNATLSKLLWDAGLNLFTLYFWCRHAWAWKVLLRGSTFPVPATAGIISRASLAAGAWSTTGRQAMEKYSKGLCCYWRLTRAAKRPCPNPGTSYLSCPGCQAGCPQEKEAGSKDLQRWETIYWPGKKLPKRLHNQSTVFGVKFDIPNVIPMHMLLGS